MKKVLLFAGLAAALSFVGCNKEADVKGLDGRKVEIILSDAQTRTVNDGMSTKWVDGDALNVFYAPAGTTTYSDNVKFDVDDAASNHATGTVELTEGTYDWYLLYPYSKYIKTPANTNSGYLTIGSQSNKTQTQAAPDDRAHLAGENLPVYGVAKAVSVNKTPTVSMKHVASVVAVNLKNSTDQPLKVDEVSFTAPEDIVGTYYIDFSGDVLGFVGSGSNYVSKTATLTVTGDESIAAGASAKFYLAIKPFAAKAGDKLAIKVNAGDLVFEKELTLPSAVEFKSGSIKSLNVDYTGGSEIESSTLEEIAAMENDTDVVTGEVLVVGKYARGIMLSQNGFYLLAFNSNGVDGAVGDIVKVSGKVGEYSGLKQITSPEVEVISSGNEVVLPEPKVLEKLDDYSSDKIELIQFTGTLSVSGSYYNVTVAGSTYKGSIQYPLDADAIKAFNNKVVTATGFFTGISGSSAKYVNMMSTDVKEAEVPAFGIEKSSFEVAANVTSVTINVTGNVDWTTNVPTGVTLDKTSGTGAATVTATFDANTSSEPKEYIIYFSTTAEGVENDEIDVTITQAGAFAGVTIDWDSYADWGLTLDDSGNVVSKETITLTDGDYVVTITKNSGSTNPFVHKTLNDARAYAKATVTVKNTKNVNMTSLIFNISEQGLKRLAPITASVGEIAAQTLGDKTVTWTGEATEVTFTVGDKAVYGTDGDTKAGQLDFSSINVVEGGQGVVNNLESISVSGQTTTFNVGDTFSFNGKVTATYSDGTTKEVTPTEVSSPDMTTAGTKEVTISYTEDGITKSVKYDITVNAAASHAGTVEDPYTVSEAIAATTALGLGNTSNESFYTKGIVSKIDEVSTEHGNATYYISDDGTTDGQFEVFRGKYIGNMNFSSTDQIQLGDEVVVYGKFTYYKSTSTPEIAQGNYISSLKRSGTAVYAFNAAASETSVFSSSSTVKVNVYGNVNWTASVDGGASVSSNSGSGIGSFNVLIPANETNSEKTYTVTVSTTASVSNSPVTLTITQAAKGSGNQIVLDLTTATYSSATEDKVVWETDAMTITVNKASANTAANNYLGGTNNRTSSRFYKGSTVTFTPKSGITVSSMLCKATTNDYATAFSGSTWTNASAQAEGNAVTVTPVDGANAMEASIGGTCGFTQIVINY